jgi:two-component system, LytTR family, sensor kinase
MADGRVRTDGRGGVSRREVALIFAFWTFLAALSIANRVLDPRGPMQHAAVTPPILLILFESYLWAALTPLVFGLAARFALGGARWVWRLPLLLGVGLVMAFAAHLLVELLRVEVLQIPRRGPAGGVMPVRLSWFLNDYIVYLGVLAAGFARDYFRRYEARNQEAARLQAEAAVLQARLAEAQLSALRMQLNPHFLFNTLHAISALVERDPAGVRRMIARLSELLRSTLDESAQAERTAEQEMDFVARYLDIMKIRFQDRLEVVTELDPRARAALLPTLILQPLVENAVKHGVARVRQGGRIVVRVERAGDRLRLTVRDNGPGVGPGAEEGGGLGLSNTRQRLQQMYGAGQDLRLTRLAEGGTLAEVEVPFRPAHDVPLLEPRAEALPVGHGR